MNREISKVSARLKYLKIISLLIISFAITCAPAICHARQEHLIQGRTMGTTYHITVVTGYFQGVSGLKEKIDARLEEINRSMSTYQKDSEISRFNRFKETGQKFKISNDFFQVMRAGQTVYRLSDGAWDATVNPLVELWGFGSGPRKNKAPSQSEIAALLPDVGFSNIEVLAPGFLLKKQAAVSIDLSSIAKGYGVDQVADVLRKKGFEDYLVEIGGEIFAAGHREDGRKWRIGINRPQAEAAFDEVYKVVELSNRAFATSGDYRNFFEVNGVRYSHVIDPRTGYPVSNGIASASIIADTCTLADGLATAVMVMGVAKGLDLINRLAGVEGLIIVEKKDGTLVDHYSKGFK
jgi:thiamine biosynthesis lipoprotein